MSEPDHDTDAEKVAEQPSRRMIVLAVSIVAVVLLACGVGVYRYMTAKSSSDTAAKTAKASETNRPYTLTPPKDWQRIQPTPEGTTVAFAERAADVDATGTLKAFIVVQSTGLNATAQKMTFDELSQMYITQLGAGYQDFTLISNDKKTIGANPAVFVTYSFVQDKAEVTASSLFVTKKGISYAVNGETLTSAWPEHAAEIEQSLLTFRP